MSFVRVALRLQGAQGARFALRAAAAQAKAQPAVRCAAGQAAWSAPRAASFHSTRAVRDAASSLSFLDKKEVTERVLTVVKNFDKVDASKVAAGAKFKEDLGLDSLDAVEVIMACEDEFSIEIPDAEADKILTPEDVIAFIVSHPQAK